VQASVDEAAEAESDIASAARERIAERLRDRCGSSVDDPSVPLERVAQTVVVIGQEPAGGVESDECS